MLKPRIAAVTAVVALLPVLAAASSLDGQRLGLFTGEEYRLTTGRCSDCPAPRQALWYFQDDLVAVPREAGAKRPSLVWVGAPDLWEQARLATDGRTVQTSTGETAPFTVVPKLATNRSYYDDTTAGFFAGRPLRIRGQRDGAGVVARQIWPEDYTLDPARWLRRDLAAGETIGSLIAAENGGAGAPYQTRAVWTAPDFDGRLDGHSALAFVLSGAQGDDDEAHGGHFALATGTIGADGAWHHWMVSNFYNLDSVSEKGIVAARLPMDHYLMDLNSGQSYYRPVYVMAVVLRKDRSARRYQEAIDPVYDSLYRHDLVYHHAAANCTGISMDALREIGWSVPRRGPTSYTKATAGFFYIWAKDRSVAKAESTFDYLTEEQTRLLPRAAFESAGEDLLRLVQGRPGRALSSYEQALVDDVAAIVFIRVPQVPSSRAMGQHPVGTFAEYQARVPADTSKWKIIPVDARPFPDELRDGPSPAPHRSQARLFAGLALGSIGTSAALGAGWVRRWRAGRRRAA
jgi:hypothetical protein